MGSESSRGEGEELAVDSRKEGKATKRKIPPPPKTPPPSVTVRGQQPGNNQKQGDDQQGEDSSPERQQPGTRSNRTAASGGKKPPTTSPSGELDSSSSQPREDQEEGALKATETTAPPHHSSGKSKGAPLLPLAATTTGSGTALEQMGPPSEHERTGGSNKRHTHHTHNSNKKIQLGDILLPNPKKEEYERERASRGTTPIPAGEMEAQQQQQQEAAAPGDNEAVAESTSPGVDTALAIHTYELPNETMSSPTTSQEGGNSPTVGSQPMKVKSKATVAADADDVCSPCSSVREAEDEEELLSDSNSAIHQHKFRTSTATFVDNVEHVASTPTKETGIGRDTSPASSGDSSSVVFVTPVATPVSLVAKRAAEDEDAENEAKTPGKGADGDTILNVPSYPNTPRQDHDDDHHHRNHEEDASPPSVIRRDTIANHPQAGELLDESHGAPSSVGTGEDQWNESNDVSALSPPPHQPTLHDVQPHPVLPSNLPPQAPKRSQSAVSQRSNSSISFHTPAPTAGGGGSGTLNLTSVSSIASSPHNDSLQSVGLLTPRGSATVVTDSSNSKLAGSKKVVATTPEFTGQYINGVLKTATRLKTRATRTSQGGASEPALEESPVFVPIDSREADAYQCSDAGGVSSSSSGSSCDRGSSSEETEEEGPLMVTRVILKPGGTSVRGNPQNSSISIVGPSVSAVPVEGEEDHSAQHYQWNDDSATNLSRGSFGSPPPHHHGSGSGIALEASPVVVPSTNSSRRKVETVKLRMRQFDDAVAHEGLTLQAQCDEPHQDHHRHGTRTPMLTPRSTVQSEDEGEEIHPSQGRRSGVGFVGPRYRQATESQTLRMQQVQREKELEVLLACGTGPDELHDETLLAPPSMVPAKGQLSTSAFSTSSHAPQHAPVMSHLQLPHQQQPVTYGRTLSAWSGLSIPLPEHCSSRVATPRGGSGRAGTPRHHRPTTPTGSACGSVKHPSSHYHDPEVWARPCGGSTTPRTAGGGGAGSSACPRSESNFTTTSWVSGATTSRRVAPRKMDKATALRIATEIVNKMSDEEIAETTHKPNIAQFHEHYNSNRSEDGKGDEFDHMYLGKHEVIIRHNTADTATNFAEGCAPLLDGSFGGAASASGSASAHGRGQSGATGFLNSESRRRSRSAQQQWPQRGQLGSRRAVSPAPVHPDDPELFTNEETGCLTHLTSEEYAMARRSEERRDTKLREKRQEERKKRKEEKEEKQRIAELRREESEVHNWLHEKQTTTYDYHHLPENDVKSKDRRHRHSFAPEIDATSAALARARASTPVAGAGGKLTPSHLRGTQSSVAKEDERFEATTKAATKAHGYQGHEPELSKKLQKQKQLIDQLKEENARNQQRRSGGSAGASAAPEEREAHISRLATPRQRRTTTPTNSIAGPAAHPVWNKGSKTSAMAAPNPASTFKRRTTTPTPSRSSGARRSVTPKAGAREGKTPLQVFLSKK